MPPELKEVILLAVMNLGTLGAGFLLGRRADEAQKIVVAGFIAAIAGTAFAWLLMMTGLHDHKVRLLSGVFIASGLLGCLWAWIGYTTRRSPDDR